MIATMIDNKMRNVALGALFGANNLIDFVRSELVRTVEGAVRISAGDVSAPDQFYIYLSDIESTFNREHFALQCKLYLESYYREQNYRQHAVIKVEVGELREAESRISIDYEYSSQAVPTVMPLRIEIINDAESVEYTLKPDSKIVIGRTSQSGIQLNKADISRYHAQIALTSDGDVIVRDLQSVNGTWVNNRKVIKNRDHRVKLPASMRLGEYSFLVLSKYEVN